MKERIKLLEEVARAAEAFKAHALYLHPESTEEMREQFNVDRANLNEALCKWRMSKAKEK